MYPYVYVMSKEAFNLLTGNGSNIETIKSYDLDYEIVPENELVERLFGHAVIIQAHLFEVFDLDDLTLDDVIIADPDVEELPGYKEITDILNESLEIIGIPYKYPFKVYVPEEADIKPKRYEYSYISIPLAFSVAVALYKLALTVLNNSDYDEVVLLKAKSDNDES